MHDAAPKHWEQITLGEIVQRGGGSIQTGPFGSQLHAADYVPVGIPSIMPVNIGDNRLIREGIACIRDSDAQRLSKHIVRTGDIVYSRRGDVERRSIVRQEQDGWFCGTGCLKVRFGDGVICPEFASFYLGHPEVRAWIVRHAVGATMPNLNTSIMAAIPFLLPPLPEQRAIASVLGALDDKIELNRRMNKTLEDMAAAIFKAWFVDFEPVHAKANGAKSFPGMPPKVFATLPKSFIDSELGQIPEGWEVKPIGDVVEIKGGGTPSTKNTEYWDEGVHPWVTPRDLSILTDPILLNTSRFLTDSGLSKVSSGLLPIGTVLLSSRAPIGYLVITAISTAINQGFIAMPPNGEVGAEYLLNWAFANMDDIKGRANGTTFQEVSKKSFRPMPILVPNAMTEGAFAQTVKKYYQQLQLNMEETQTLTEIRDTLLPKLLSGEVRIKEAFDG